MEHRETIARVVHENFGGVTGVGIVNKTNRLTGTPKVLLVLHTEVQGGPTHVINAHIGQLLEQHGFEVRSPPSPETEKPGVVVAKGPYRIIIKSQTSNGKSRAGAIMLHQINLSEEDARKAAVAMMQAIKRPA